jgi:hypothetical protein
MSGLVYFMEKKKNGLGLFIEKKEMGVGNIGYYKFRGGLQEPETVG